MKVSILHMEIRNTIEDNLTAAKNAVLKAAKQKPALIALPEYFTVPNCMADFKTPKKYPKKPAPKHSSFFKKSPKQSATFTFSEAQYYKKIAANTTTPALFGETVNYLPNTKKSTR